MMGFLSKKKDKDKKFETYVDPSQEFTTGELKASFWYLRHRQRMKKIGIGALIAWCIVTVGYGGTVWVHYALLGYWQDKDMLRGSIETIQNYEQLHRQFTAKDLQYETTHIFKTSGENMYDFVTGVTNQNRQFVAFVTYRYSYAGGQQTPTQGVIVLPQKRQLLVSLGEGSSLYPAQARLVVEKVEWRRIDPHRIRDIAAYVDERLAFVVENLSFVPSRSAEGVPVPQVKFDLLNTSVYSYWEPFFYLELLNGRQPVGVIPFSVQSFLATSMRPMDLRPMQDISSLTEVVLVPRIDIFDPSQYVTGLSVSL